MNLAQHLLMLSVRAYQLVLSPAKTVLFGSLARCRFEPSCSQYALEAVRDHGALRGAWLAFWRLLRCHPWGGAGYDPVPMPNGTTHCDCLHGRRSARVSAQVR